MHEILQSLSSVCPRGAILCFDSEIERDGCEAETSYELAAGGTGGEGEFVSVEDVEWTVWGVGGGGGGGGITVAGAGGGGLAL